MIWKNKTLEKVIFLVKKSTCSFPSAQKHQQAIGLPGTASGKDAITQKNQNQEVGQGQSSRQYLAKRGGYSKVAERKNIFVGIT